MQRDKLLFLPRHRVLANQVALDICDEYVDGTLIVCIGGKSGTGKSEVAYLAKDLIEANGLRTYIFTLDDYYKPDHEANRRENILLVGKDEIKRKIGRSPDISDAIMMRMYLVISGME